MKPCPILKKLSQQIVDCDYCDSTYEVLTAPSVWRAGGRNCFSFGWSKSGEQLSLCGECECEEFVLCVFCGSLMENDYGIDKYFYANKDRSTITDDPEFVCPECWEKNKIEIRAKRKLFQLRKRPRKNA